jgi:hypothetical protein
MSRFDFVRDKRAGFLMIRTETSDFFDQNGSISVTSATSARASVLPLRKPFTSNLDRHLIATCRRAPTGIFDDAFHSRLRHEAVLCNFDGRHFGGHA